MIFEWVEVENVRNIVTAKFELQSGLNVVTGLNGSGKTALLEALHLLIRGRSFRTNNTDSLIQHGQSSVLVRSQLQDADQSTELAVYKALQQPIRMKFRGEAVKQLSLVAQVLPVQVVQSDIAELVFGSPRLRREWLDWGVFHQEPEYFETIRQWRRSLEQRNAALRSQNKEASRTWSSSVGNYGDQVTKLRQGYLSRLQPLFSQCLGYLNSPFDVELSLAKGYTSDRLEEDLQRGLDKDLQTRVTQIGPQRADVRLHLSGLTQSDTGSRAAQILSRGQGKIVAYAMKTAQAQLLRELYKYTVYLVDDIESELDATYKSSFIDLLLSMGSQIIATTTTSASQLSYLEALREGPNVLFEMCDGALNLVKL